MFITVEGNRLEGKTTVANMISNGLNKTIVSGARFFQQKFPFGNVEFDTNCIIIDDADPKEVDRIKDLIQKNEKTNQLLIVRETRENIWIPIPLVIFTIRSEKKQVMPTDFWNSKYDWNPLMGFREYRNKAGFKSRNQDE